ncbi:hypothetical protein LCGC14_1824480 [marine sediment metagenome]|uniref:DUF5679 domain-containing protein n=1 Tax=marine sediment metagenome TaxID=412755 RepID=A0A0F9IXP1_9ZZZZ
MSNNEKHTAYCMKCKAKVDVENPEVVVMKGKGKRRAVKGKCVVCKTNVYAILKKKIQ